MSDRTDLDPSASATGISDIIHDAFDYPAHRVVGTCAEARAWVDNSILPARDKSSLRSFVERFPAAAFYRDDSVLLDHLESRNEVVLPQSIREVRQVLSGLGPDAEVRFDDFENNLSPRADHVDDDDGYIDLWYGDRFSGYLQDEDRDLLRTSAECYPILCATTGVNYLLAADLRDSGDGRVIDVCDEDIMDNRYDGIPGTESVYMAFESYARMLAHVVEYRMADGVVIRA